MELRQLIETYRDFYINQFTKFIALNHDKHEKSSGEVKFSLESNSNFFKNKYCADFAYNENGEPHIIELSHDKSLKYDAALIDFDGTSVEIIECNWDNVTIEHDIKNLDSNVFSHWFDYWFDIEENRYDANNPLCFIIHSMLISGNQISLDLGSSESGSLYELIKILNANGAKNLKIYSPYYEEKL